MTFTDNSLDRTYVEYLDAPIIDDIEEVQQISDQPSWRDPLVKYLIEETLLNDFLEAKWIKWMASQYVQLDGQLYKRSFSLPLAKCLKKQSATMLSKKFMKEFM